VCFKVQLAGAKLGKNGLDCFEKNFWNYFAFNCSENFLNQMCFLRSLSKCIRFFNSEFYFFDHGLRFITRWRSKQATGPGGYGAVFKIWGPSKKN